MNFNKDKLNKFAGSVGKKVKSLGYHSGKSFTTFANNFAEESLLGVKKLTNKEDQKNYWPAAWAGKGAAYLYSPASQGLAKVLGKGIKAVKGTKAGAEIIAKTSKAVKRSPLVKNILQKARYKNKGRKGQKMRKINENFKGIMSGNPKDKGRIIVQHKERIIPGPPSKLNGKKIILKKATPSIPGTSGKKGTDIFKKITLLGKETVSKTPLNLLGNTANIFGKNVAKYAKKGGEKLLYPKGRIRPNNLASLPQRYNPSTGNRLGKILSSDILGTTLNAGTQGLTYGAGYAGAKFGADAASAAFDKNTKFEPSAAIQRAWNHAGTSGLVGLGLGAFGGIAKPIIKGLGSAVANRAIFDFAGFSSAFNNKSINKALDKISGFAGRFLKKEDLKHFYKLNKGTNKNQSIEELIKNSTGKNKVALVMKALANRFPGAQNIQGIGNVLEKNKEHMKKSFHITDGILSSSQMFKGLSKYVQPLEKQQIATTAIKGNSVNVQTFKKIKNYGKSLATPGMDYKDVMDIINNNKLAPSLEAVGPRALGQYNSLKKAVGELFKTTNPDGSTVVLDTIPFNKWRDFYLKSRNQYIEEGKTLLRTDLDNNLKKVYSEFQDAYTKKSSLFLNPREFNLNKLNKEYSENEKLLDFVNNFSANKGSLNFQERWLLSKALGWGLTGAGTAAASISKGQSGSLKTLHDVAEKVAGEASQPGKIWGKANIGYARSNNEEEDLTNEMSNIQLLTNNPELEDFKDQKLEDSKKIRTETPSILDKFKQQKAEDMEMRL